MFIKTLSRPGAKEEVVQNASDAKYNALNTSKILPSSPKRTR
jgi:hypothetical protein